MVTGSPTLLANTWTNLAVLRHRGCQLPIELWHFGSETAEVDNVRGIFEVGVGCRALGLFKPFRGLQRVDAYSGQGRPLG